MMAALGDPTEARVPLKKINYSKMIGNEQRGLSIRNACLPALARVTPPLHQQWNACSQPWGPLGCSELGPAAVTVH